MKNIIRIDGQSMNPQDEQICESACEYIISSRQQARASGKHTDASWLDQSILEQLGKGARHAIQAMREELKKPSTHVEAHQHMHIPAKKLNDALYWLSKAREAMTHALVSLDMTTWTKHPDEGEKAIVNAVARLAQGAALQDYHRRPVENCGHVGKVDGCCEHPRAMTPECHKYVACPMQNPNTSA